MLSTQTLVAIHNKQSTFDLYQHRLVTYTLFFALQAKIFQKEVQIYTFLIPKIQDIRASKGLEPLPFPKCFYASAEEELLVMENLKLQKFEVIEKKPERKKISIPKILILNN